ncbi:TPA: cyanophycinase [Klebsiella pneumoniae]|uniref:cyanophycinase n=2 Tax=Klebsiella pneumoniae TaxID=573 RepID=UPI000D59D30D|nr:cyanophycinase [Klebsiella pneumoniae]HBX8239877.1 cyanophycinase [Klebsiella pneumoniae]HCM5370794.1 cyanophycinase [Klebsiella variicola subsp. variicola]HDS6868537.1 cyanophycinase [Klebsiella pneumoniae subsp. pneumoniae]
MTFDKERRPRLVIIGGRLEDDNEAIYAGMHRLAAGRIVIFPTASSEPEVVGAETVAVFQAHGFDAVLAPVYGEQAAQAACDPAIAELVRDYGSVFFTGGNQSFIVDALEPAGKESLVLKTIRAAHAAGGLVAGSSAGAAMMSDTMIVGGTSLEAATFGVITSPDLPGMLLGQGLGLFHRGIVDQHFIKRGRLGRLIIAMMENHIPYGFGIDENTALFVDGDDAWVCGEYGVFVLDMRNATYDRVGRSAENIIFSYLDDGDGLDLTDMQARVNPDKMPVSGQDVAYSAPARSLRNVFGAYTLYDLLARLVLGSPESYNSDSASAIDPKSGMATTIEFARISERSKPFILIRNNELRMTALDFRARLVSAKLNASQLRAHQYGTLSRDYGIKPRADSRLVLLGSTPLAQDSRLLDDVLNLCVGEVGIIAAASASPRSEADRYVRALEERGIEAIDFNITIDNIERLGLDRAIVERIAGLKTIILTGGNQIRLVEALLHRGEVTPVLQALIHAYAMGAVIIAVSGAAAALSGFMIAGGSSYEALRFGIASDMGRRGLVLQEGLGLFGSGIIDQNLASTRRLGRLIVACAEEGVRYGLGICEDSGFITQDNNTLLTVIGARGVMLVETDATQITLQGDDFIAAGTRLTFALPGDVINLDTGLVYRQQPGGLADSELERLVEELIEECGGSSCSIAGAPLTLRFNAAGDGRGVLEMASLREKHG